MHIDIRRIHVGFAINLNYLGQWHLQNNALIFPALFVCLTIYIHVCVYISRVLSMCGADLRASGHFRITWECTQMGAVYLTR